MADLSKITLPSGTTYNLKDQGARDLIDALTGYTKFLGVTTTAISDGSTTNPVTIGGQSVTAETGDIVTYGSGEFIWNGSQWQAFGDLSALGDLAYQDSASGTFTPHGSVSLTSGNTTATVSKTTGTATYTPEGSVSTPTITVTPTITTIKNPTAETVAKTVVAAAPGATAPANAVTYYAVDGETLKLYQLGYTTGDSITVENETVATGIASATSTQPSFTGTGARLVTGNISVPTGASFTGTAESVTVS